MNIGIIGGGNVGGALARLAMSAGHDVVVGVREPGRLANGIDAVASRQAAMHAEIVILALPYVACVDALPALRDVLAGKIVVDATNPLNADWSPLLLGQENSAAEEIARLLPASRVVKAFNTIFADTMIPERMQREGGYRITAFVVGDDDTAVAHVADLAYSLGFAPQRVGGLAAARYVEAMAHLNIAIAMGGGGTNACFLFDQKPV